MTQTVSAHSQFMRRQVYLEVYFLGFCICMALVLTNHKLNQIPDIHAYSAAHFQMYDFMTADREIENSHPEQRKKLRWVGKKIELQIYQAFQEQFNLPLDSKYPFLIYYSIFVFLTLYSSGKIFLHLQGSNAKFDKEFLKFFSTALCFYIFCFQYTGINEQFSLIEASLITVAILATLRQQPYFFFSILVFVICIRESGILVGLIYPLFNFQKALGLRLFFFPLISCLILIFANFDLFWTSHQVFSYQGQFEGRETLVEFFSDPKAGKSGSFLVYLIFFSILYCFAKICFKDAFFRQVMALITVYLLVLFIGSFFGNLDLLILLFGPMITLVGKSFLEI